MTVCKACWQRNLNLSEWWVKTVVRWKMEMQHCHRQLEPSF